MNYQCSSFCIVRLLMIFNSSYCILVGTDYGGLEVIPVEFKVGVNRVVVPIPIIDDQIAECPENFSVELVIPKETIGVAAGLGRTALMSINDNDGTKLLTYMRV